MRNWLMRIGGNLAVLISFASIVCCGQLQLASAEEYKRWEVIELAFEVDAGAGEAPFEREFDAVFTSPNGNTLKVPGFYNGEDEYLLRFSTGESGEWSYKTKSSDESLNEKSGTLLISSTAKKGLGPVVVDPENPLKFQHADGLPHQMLAFEIDWLFALDYDNDKDIPKTKQLIQQIKKNGFNTVVMNVYANDVVWDKDESILPEHEYGSRDIFPFDGSNETPDHSTLNVEFFQKLDRVVSYLNDEDVSAHLMLYVWNKKVSWPDMDTPEDNRYYDYVLKRYQAFPNIQWDVSKEAFAYGRATMDYIVSRSQRTRELDAFQRLLTVHSTGFAKKHPELVDFVSVQNWANELHIKMMELTENSDKPILMVENGCYEFTRYVVFSGSYDDAETCLDRSYVAMFAGAYTSHYWQSVAWNVIEHDIEKMPEEQRPKLEYYAHLTKFFDDADFSNLKPLGQQTTCNTGFTLVDAAKTHHVYVPSINHSMWCARHLDDFEHGYAVEWFNTLTGETIREEFKDDNNAKGWRKKPWRGVAAVLSFKPLQAE